MITEFLIDIIKLTIGIFLGTYLGTWMMERKIRKTLKKLEIEKLLTIIKKFLNDQK